MLFSSLQKLKSILILHWQGDDYRQVKNISQKTHDGHVLEGIDLDPVKIVVWDKSQDMFEADMLGSRSAGSSIPQVAPRCCYSPKYCPLNSTSHTMLDKGLDLKASTEPIATFERQPL